MNQSAACLSLNVRMCEFHPSLVLIFSFHPALLSSTFFPSFLLYSIIKQTAMAKALAHHILCRVVLYYLTTSLLLSGLQLQLHSGLACLGFAFAQAPITEDRVHVDMQDR